MKRHNNLYEKIYDMDNLILAHTNARKGKTHYDEVKKVDSNTEKYLKELQTLLIYEKFKNSKYKIFNKIDKGKLRTIYKLPYFPDRILHHAIMQVLEPIWKKSLIRDTYQSIKGRGVSDARCRVQRAVRGAKAKYCLKIDIKKYYPSINNKILLQILKSKIKCVKTINILKEIVNSAIGVPIGNYLSQYFGNLYLMSFDHWAKEQMKIKHYYRYCDDIIILNNFKKKLHRILKSIIRYLKDKLLLTLKSNYQIFPVKARGIDFVGYKFFKGITLLRKSIAKRFKAKVSDIKKHWHIMPAFKVVSGLASYWGWIKPIRHTLWNKYVTQDILQIIKHKINESTIRHTAIPC